MNNIDKTLLLAEKFGVDVSSFTSSYLDAIICSPSYTKLVENVSWANDFPLKKAVALVADFKSLNYSINTFEESIVLSSRINFLYSVSSEAYYLNPLFSYAKKLKTQSLGDLVINYNGADHTINHLIKDKKKTLDFKGKVIVGAAESYRLEMNDLLANIYSKTKNNIGLRSIVHKVTFVYLLKAIVAVVLFAGDIYMMLSNREVLSSTFANLTNLGAYSLENWGFLAFYVFSMLLFFFTMLLGCKISYIFTPYYYFVRFGRSKINGIYQKVNKRAQELGDYLYKACKEERELSKDIAKFKMPNKYQGELALYAECYNIKKNKGYKALNFIGKMFLVLSILAAVYLTVVILLRKYGVI